MTNYDYSTRNVLACIKILLRKTCNKTPFKSGCDIYPHTTPTSTYKTTVLCYYVPASVGYTLNTHSV